MLKIVHSISGSMNVKRIGNFHINSIPLIIIVSFLWLIGANLAFFRHLLADYPLNTDNLFFIASVTIGAFCLMVLVLSLLCWRYTTKPVLILLLLTTACTAYFMDSYDVLIDTDMVKNVFATDVREAKELWSVTFVLYLLILGIIPAFLVWRTTIHYRPFLQESGRRIIVIASVLIISATLFWVQSGAFHSFFREHKAVRFYANPASTMFAVSKVAVRSFTRPDRPADAYGNDARLPVWDKDRELIIMVVGETARADHFSLNGYTKLTNPLLAQEDVVSFTKVTSCGTSTNISVPCMFSHFGVDEYDADKARSVENALDVAAHAKVNILWRDNNSSSKNVADRLPYEDYRTPDHNKVCDDECRDEGMLIGLQDYINAHPKGDILIVLHSMGNHGPAYYKRYPEHFEYFTPACKTNELSDCSLEEINNAYDNAIRYTDYFLSKVIAFLKSNDDRFETMMLYVSDHGESLGENGMYLHGMPNFIAPKTQRHVPVIMWLGKHFDETTIDALRAKQDKPWSHDNIFHTILGTMEIQSNVYNKQLDLIHN